MKLLNFFISLLLFLTHSAYAADVQLLNNEQAIYSAVLEHFGAAKRKIILVHEKSENINNTLMKRWIALAIERKGELFQNTLLSFQKRNQRQTQIPLKDVFPKKRFTLKKIEHDHIFHNGPEGWDILFSKYPDSGYLYGFSRVGFDSKNETAMVYFTLGCGPLCGYGYLVYLHRKGQQWDVEVTERTWIS